MTNMTEQKAVAVIEQSPEQRAALVLGAAGRAAELRALVAKSADITEVKNADGRDQAHQVAMVLRSNRTTIEKQGKAARDDATKFSKAVIAQEKALIAIIEPEEERVLALRDEWDAEQQRIKDAAIAAERARVEGIEALIAGIAESALRHAASNAGTIAAAIAQLEGLALDEVTYHEFVGQAEQAKGDALDTMRELLAAAQQREQEAAEARERAETEKRAAAAERERLAAAAAEMERVRAELAAAQARLEQDRRDQEEKERAAQLERDRKAKQASDELAAQQRKLDDERAAFVAEQAAAANAAKAAAELALDHDEALAMNAQHDAERLARDHAEAIEQDIMRTALAAGERITADAPPANIGAMLDAISEEEPTDQEIVELVAQSFGMTAEQAMERLSRFVADNT